MKCLSIHLFWAWAIVQGHKTVENRTWATSHRGPLLIHASRSRASDVEARAALEVLGIDVPGEVPRGALVGRVDLVDVVDMSAASTQRFFTTGFDRVDPSADPLATGPKCWILRRAEAFSRPVPYPGALGLFDVVWPVAERAG